MQVTGEWRTRAATQEVMAALGSQGNRALFVGGCVRNAILGRGVADIDIATDAAPDVVAALATEAGFNVAPTGLAHGTVTVIAQGVAHEVTTFRRDEATDGRHATVAFTTSLEDDASRRDFTMNALYATADGTVVDPLGGLPDIEARRVRFVGDAGARIAEDYLRILRFFRFTAIYGDPQHGPDAEALAACAGSAEGLDRISRERVGWEVRQLLDAPDPAPAVAAMAQTGVLHRILPGTDPRALAVLVHLEEGDPVSWVARLAALGGPDPTKALRLSKVEAEGLRHIAEELAQDATPAVLGWRWGAMRARAIGLLRAATVGQMPQDQWHEEIVRGAQAAFPVAPSDLMPALEGKALGEALLDMEARWVASDLTLTRDDLLG